MEELIQRCSWATTDLYKEYHDNEWGKPVHDENKLFEMLILEGMQAGLSWLTILNKREAFRIAFDNFDVKKVSNYDSFSLTCFPASTGLLDVVITYSYPVRGAVIAVLLSSEACTCTSTRVAI